MYWFQSGDAKRCPKNVSAASLVATSWEFYDKSGTLVWKTVFSDHLDPKSPWAAKLMGDLGPRSVLVKGGDLTDSLDAIDIFFDAEEFYELSSSRGNTCNTHCTGCTLPSSLATELTKGSSMLSVVKVAKCYVDTAIVHSRENGCLLLYIKLLLENRFCCCLIQWHGLPTDDTSNKNWKEWKNLYNLEDKG